MKKTSKKTPKKKFTLKLPAWLLLAVMIPVYETFLHLGTMNGFLPQRYSVVAIFALGFACALGLLVSFLPPKAQKWTGLALAAVLGVLCIVQYFIHDAYQVFMTFSGIINGAGGVATNYLDVVLGLLGRNLWKIVLLLLPLFLYGKFVTVPRPRWKTRLCLLCVAASMYMMGCGLVFKFGVDADKFTLSTAENFNNSVESFGLHMGVGMDMLSSGNQESLEFDTSFQVPELPVPTVKPTEPAATEIPDVSGATEATDATEAPTEPPRVYKPHALDLDFAAMAEAEKRDYISSIHSYMASQTPAMENDFTGMFEGKNLIFITAEAFSPAAVDPERTPVLYRMITEGIHFTDYYQPVWGAGTTGGEYTNLLSLVPYGSSASMEEVTQQDIFHAIGKQLQERGYSSAAFHNNDHTYYNRHKTHTSLGYDIFMGVGNGMEEGISRGWPQSDEEMFRFTIPQYLDKQPFSLYYMTVSGHATYLFKNNTAAQRNKEYVDDLPYSEPVKAYLACNMELEHSVAYLLETLEANGILDDTVVVISPDHYPYGLAPSDTWGTNRDYLAELMGQVAKNSFIRDQAPLIIWSGCLEDMDLTVDAPTMSLDILPTLSNLFGVEYDSRLMCGRDVFSDQPALAFWLDGSWKTSMGSYNGNTGVFTPAEGVEVDSTYVDAVRATIKNKCTFSKAVTYYDYFNYITKALEENAQATEPQA